MAAAKKASKGERRKAAPSQYEFNDGDLSALELSAHDINMISIVAQRPKLENSELMNLIRAGMPSQDALDIVKIILEPKEAKKALADSELDPGAAAKLAIARNYMAWAKALSSD